jgi:hypothetical protein
MAEVGWICEEYDRSIFPVSEGDVLVDRFHVSTSMYLYATFRFHSSFPPIPLPYHLHHNT